MNILDILDRRNVGAAPHDIDNLEQRMGRPVPSQLRELLEVANGGALRKTSRLGLPDGSVAGSFDLIPTGKIHDVSTALGLGEDWPWCRDGLGNVLVVDDNNQVSFWDHDTGELMRLECDLMAFDQVVENDEDEDAAAVPAPSGSRLLDTIEQGDEDAAITLVRETPAVDLGQALFLSCSYGYVRLAGVLLDAGADIEWRPAPGARTPLIAARSFGLVDIVKMLLARGADPHAETAQGRTALQIAAITGRDDVLRVLREQPSP